MRKNIKAPSFVVIAILTLITILFWIGFEVYRTFTKKADPVVPPEVLTPLDPTLDAHALDKLQERMQVEESEIGEIILVATPTPTPSELPTSTPFELPTPTEEITTEGGTLSE